MLGEILKLRIFGGVGVARHCELVVSEHAAYCRSHTERDSERLQFRSGDWLRSGASLRSCRGCNHTQPLKWDYCQPMRWGV